jgi:hypothetical protein
MERKGGRGTVGCWALALLGPGLGPVGVLLLFFCSFSFSILAANCFVLFEKAKQLFEKNKFQIQSTFK